MSKGFCINNKNVQPKCSKYIKYNKKNIIKFYSIFLINKNSYSSLFFV